MNLVVFSHVISVVNIGTKKAGIMSEIVDSSLLKTGIRVIHQRYCLKCGKILPTKIKQNYTHNCEKPDFLL